MAGHDRLSDSQRKLLAAANYLTSDEFKEFLLNVYMEYEQRKDELRISDTTETADVPALQTTEKIPPSVSSLRQVQIQS